MVSSSCTTESGGFFYVNSALISRSQVFELKPLSAQSLLKILDAALQDRDRGLGNMKIQVDSDALRHIAKMSDGDARKALSALELAALTATVR